MITARSHMGYVNFNDRIYAIGGQRGNDDALVAQSVVEVYDPATDTWSAKRSMPKGVNHISSSTFVMGGRILTLGGQTSHNSPIADTYAYDPDDRHVGRRLSPLPTARFSGVARRHQRHDLLHGRVVTDHHVEGHPRVARSPLLLRCPTTCPHAGTEHASQQRTIARSAPACGESDGTFGHICTPRRVMPGACFARKFLSCRDLSRTDRHDQIGFVPRRRCGQWVAHSGT